MVEVGLEDGSSRLKGALADQLRQRCGYSTRCDPVHPLGSRLIACVYAPYPVMSITD